jgi:hypothetical protein
MSVFAKIHPPNYSMVKQTDSLTNGLGLSLICEVDLIPFGLAS